jgi:hypothetical protein
MVLSSLVSAQQESQARPPAPQPQKPAEKKPPEPQDPLKVVISGARIQDVEDGLLFQVEVSNTSSAPVSLYDPSDVMDISLVGDEGFPSALPPPHPMLMIEGGDRKKMRAMLDQKRSFTVVAASGADLTEGTKTLADLNSAGEILLPPGAKFVMTVRISKILADAAAFIAAQREHAAKADPQAAPPPDPETQPIPHDRYAVRVLIPFVSNGKPIGRFLISNEIKVDLN